MTDSIYCMFPTRRSTVDNYPAKRARLEKALIEQGFRKINDGVWDHPCANAHDLLPLLIGKVQRFLASYQPERVAGLKVRFVPFSSNDLAQAQEFELDTPAQEDNPE